MDEAASVLVVDDEPAITRALTAALAARGYRVASAATGQEALSRVATDWPTVVVLDLGLPDLDGLEEVWGPGYGTESQYLRVYASQERKKIDDDPAPPRLITEPGVGYRLVDRGERLPSG